MPALQNLRHERFAQLRAKGYSLEEAYELAGFVRDSGHASRMAGRPKVAARIAEIRLEIGQNAPRANLEQTIAGLLSLVERAEGWNTPAHLSEARSTLLEAHRLHQLWVEARAQDRERIAQARARRSATLPEACPNSARAPKRPRPDVAAEGSRFQ